MTPRESKISVSVSIMAHPRRADRAHNLAAQLQQFPARVVFDPSPSHSPATIRTAREAWVPYAGCTHHLVLQDDVELHPAFESQVSDAVSAQPDAVLSFFSEWGSFTSHALRVGAFAGRPWIRQVDTYLGTQASLMSASVALDFAEYLTHQSEKTPDDHAIFDFVREQNLPYFVSNPNLVEHERQASLIGNSPQGVRRSTIFVPEFTAPREWWQLPPLPPAKRLPTIHWSTAEATTYEAPLPGTGPRWNIRPSRRAWGELTKEVDQLINDRLSCLNDDPKTQILSQALYGLAVTLCEQIAVSHVVALPDNGRFARICTTRAIESMIPGSLRQIIPKEVSQRELQTLCEALLDITGSIQESVIPRLDVNRVLSEYWDTSEVDDGANLVHTA